MCYCLGITSVDPSKFDLLFERFISSARNEPPDIDVDFEHERREEVIQYIYQKYGRHRAAIVATVTQQHHKGAIQDVGKAMGLSVDTINRLSGLIWDFKDEGFDRNRLTSQGINPDDSTVRKVLQLTEQFMGFPRQLGQHTGGFVITEGKPLKAHPVSFVGAQLERFRVLPVSKLADKKDGDIVKVAGLILVRQRPGTASGICFITIEMKRVQLISLSLQNCSINSERRSFNHGY